ncbi:bifunctional methylenetetrahydrofolate dehydrogenase/methenyltetrahydrofolate cyclohydrolase [Candidatus Micrarchaeota archaeon]|nr:bifunctional methylenetetrahydrofolate dehydrogenase/methenyltetrahydrofolate cyclohydrolase [Candidatus Micrarchaeota archaeon]MBU2476389.1 bifunctional methylenetetrahydrofolate dehydrogenase/methenyltetrahydrofolate cyclohydrolase [Candidatus Micrarchaeota archaeon]
MAARVFDGKKLAEKIKEKIAKEIKEKNLKPKLSLILVGNDPASQVYVKKKHEACQEIGIISDQHFFTEKASEKEITELIEILNKDPEVSGILVQLPLPEQISVKKVINLILPEKDVDGFHPVNIGKASIGQNCFFPATPLGILRLIEEEKIELQGKNVVIVGTSNIVGKPLGLMLLNKNATITYCNKFTKDLKEFTKKADILISAVGKPKLITKDMVKKNAIVIDVGTTRNETGKLTGDVDFEEVKKTALFITPVPGGVGPLTVACLMENTLKAEKQSFKKRLSKTSEINSDCTGEKND